MGILLLSGAVTTAPASANAPVRPAFASYSVAMTGYNAVPAQTDGDPFTTASGAYSNPEVVAARSQDLGEEMPFGTIIEIDGPKEKSGTCGFGAVSDVIGYRVIADTMNVKFTDRIDVLFPTKANYLLPDGRTMNAANLLGVCEGVTVRVVGRIDLTNPKNLPKTQGDLAAIVTGGTDLALK
jgi:3D (Asp-Asp-Asp) domain-containing protein